MALALDASTPVVVTSSLNESATTTITTASFTPPAGAVLLVIFGSNANAETLSTFLATDNLATHLTYTQQQQAGLMSNDVQMTIWSSSAVVTSAAMTVSAKYNTTNSGIATAVFLRVLVFTGANTTSPIGAKGSARVTTNVSTTYVSTVAGSWGWMGYADWTQKGVPTVAAAETVDSSYNPAGLDSYAAIKQTSTTTSAGTTVTMSTATPSSAAQISYAYVEVVPAAGAVTIHSLSLSGVGA